MKVMLICDNSVKLIELDRSVVILSPVLEIGYNVRSANIIALRTNHDPNKLIALPVEKYYERTREV